MTNTLAYSREANGQKECCAASKLDLFISKNEEEKIVESDFHFCCCFSFQMWRHDIQRDDSQLNDTKYNDDRKRLADSNI